MSHTFFPYSVDTLLTHSSEYTHIPIAPNASATQPTFGASFESNKTMPRWVPRTKADLRANVIDTRYLLFPAELLPRG